VCIVIDKIIPRNILHVLVQTVMMDSLVADMVVADSLVEVVEVVEMDAL
jgi:hypothetical protein